MNFLLVGRRTALIVCHAISIAITVVLPAWQDINFETGHIHIKQSLVYDEDGFRFTEPKTENSKRGILVHEKVVKALKKHKKTQNEFKLLFGNSYHDYDLIFCREDGKPVYPRTLALKFDKIIKNAEVPKIRIHDLRHTHATILMELGENPKIVADRLGHSSIRTTLDTYSHVTPSMQQETARKFGEAILKGNG